ncbi:MAG: relaxase/mobilization nuclease domain-containing protein [Coriobacteriales bacterium]
MAMLKTASSGVTNVTGLKNYLEKEQRQEAAQHRQEWDLYEKGQVDLTPRQVRYMEDYLGAGSRGLAVDVSPDLTPENWARQMDLTRARFGHDRPSRKGTRNRTYYHFVLSPAAEDACTLSTMRRYTCDWAESNFRAGGRRHEYAAVYHDDNTNRLLHAHVVVNVTDMNSGRKLHLDNDEVVALQISAQEIGKRYGLTPLREQMQTTIGARTNQPIYLSKAEREIMSKGGYSWKWELRRLVMQLAPLSADLEDLKRRLEEQGCDVGRSPKTGHLLYTHRNGRQVKDSQLGAYFYLDSLEKVFSHELAFDDRTYKYWELMQISKGELPWKEEIRQAVDAIAPTVLSVPELQEALEAQYGIRLIINRRGITYQHAAGFKVRDVGIGLRYTQEGLLHNAAVGEAGSYPSAEEINEAAEHYAQSFLPGSSHGAVDVSGSLLAGQLIYQDFTELMTRMGLSRAEELGPALERQRQELMEEKAQITQLRDELMNWNRLASLKRRMEQDRRFLEDEGESADPALYNETLLRYERLRLYLHEQTGGADPQEKQAALNQQYEQLVQPYQERLALLNRDQVIFQNYLVTQGVTMGWQLQQGREKGVGPEAFFAMSSTFAKYHIKDFYHLNCLLSDKEAAVEEQKKRLEKAAAHMRDAQLIRDDINTYLEMRGQLPQAQVLAEHSPALGSTVQKYRYEGARYRLEKAGIHEDSFGIRQQECLKAELDYKEIKEELESMQSVAVDLREAWNISVSLSDAVKEKAGYAPDKEERVSKRVFEELPFDAARRRVAEHGEKAKGKPRLTRDGLQR